MDKLSVVLVAVLAAISLGEALSGMVWDDDTLIAIGSVLFALG